MNTPEKPIEIEAAIKAVEEAQAQLREAAEKLKSAMSVLMAVIVVEGLRAE
jgi:hypothetical protein